MTSVIAPLRRAESTAGGDTAVVCGETRITYAEMGDRCRRLIAALSDLGIDAGDRVAVVAGNCHRFLELYQSIPGAGMAIVPLNPRHSVAELRYALEDSDARILFSALGSEGFDDV